MLHNPEQLDRRRPADQGARRQPAEGGRLVRQRVGLLLPRRRPDQVPGQEGPVISSIGACATKGPGAIPALFFWLLAANARGCTRMRTKCFYWRVFALNRGPKSFHGAGARVVAGTILLECGPLGDYLVLLCYKVLTLLNFPAPAGYGRREWVSSAHAPPPGSKEPKGGGGEL